MRSPSNMADHFYPNHFAHPPQPQREPAQRAAYCPTNMHRNKTPILLWRDVVVVARHVVARYKEIMYLFKRSKPAPHVISGVRSLYLIRDVCINKGTQSKIPTWSTIMQVAVITFHVFLTCKPISWTTLVTLWALNMRRRSTRSFTTFAIALQKTSWSAVCLRPFLLDFLPSTVRHGSHPCQTVNHKIRFGRPLMATVSI